MTDPSLRLFFALWPTAGPRTAIAELGRRIAAETGARAVADDNIHLTLAFLGERPATQLAALQALGAGVQAGAFRLMLDTLGCWRKTGIVWLGTTSAPDQVLALQRRLVAVLAEMGIIVDDRPFAPHVTLARRMATPVQRTLPEPIVWDVDSFALIASQTDRAGPSYRRIAVWPLRLGAC